MKSRRRTHALLFALLAALLITSVAGAAPKDGAVVSLSVNQGDFAATQDVLVTVTVSNPTRHTVRVLKWFTPAEGVEESLFAVMRDGQAVAYTGPLYKRPAATGQDYITLRSGESISATVSLGEYYDLSQSGVYEIFYAVAAYNLFDEKGNSFQARDVLISEKISVSIEGRAPRAKPTPPPTPTPGGTAFNACTVDQQALLLQARTDASAYAANSEAYLNAGTQGLRYTTWFGAYLSSRYTTVKTNFTRISDAMDTAGITFDCKCKQNYYAYVYSNDPYKIYLCKVFWQAPATGTDSKAGTQIHEMSHFDVVAGTEDWVYGQTNARNLASSDPNKAIENADNHEYFAENTPSLP
ncbi:MAG TPA: M35 family metallo-endopeptidase [Anaerolineales bacterium]|nr:M35 family metallo-endopeptidase [Anaerolineales bacterium]